LLAQGDFDKVLELWLNISIEQLFCEDELSLIELVDANGFKADIKQMLREGHAALNKILHNKGFHTEKMKTLLERYIDEEKIRLSGKDFGLVAISLSERRPYELMLENIQSGRLVNYIMASASLPGFHPETIEGNSFLDGGLYNNCPYNLLSKKGYDEIIVVRITKTPIFHRPGEPRVKFITPSDDLGNILLFSPENSASKIELGYYDGLRHVESWSENMTLCD